MIHGFSTFNSTNNYPSFQKKEEKPSVFEENAIQNNEVKKKEFEIEAARVEKNLVRQILEKHLSANQLVINPVTVRTLCNETGLRIDGLLEELVTIAKERALPSIFHNKTGAAGLGASGAIYLGFNLEFKGFQLNQIVHSAQFVAALARKCRETVLIKIALSGELCGPCRQFLGELDEEAKVVILTPDNTPITLSTLLPKSLEIKGRLLDIPESIEATHSDELIKEAIESAYKSYAPYTNSPSGVAIETEDNKYFSGSYCENGAYNPTLPPLQAALITLLATGRNFTGIKRVVLVEKKDALTQHALITEAIVKSIAPQATFLLEHI